MLHPLLAHRRVIDCLYINLKPTRVRFLSEGQRMQRPAHRVRDFEGKESSDSQPSRMKRLPCSGLLSLDLRAHHSGRLEGGNGIRYGGSGKMLQVARPTLHRHCTIRVSKALIIHWA